MYSVFGCPGTLLLINYYYYYFCMVATSRLYVTVSYGSCVVAASDLYSTVSYGGAVQTPGAMCTCRGCTISQQNRVVRTSAFCAHVLRGYLWASPTFFFFFCRRWESNYRFLCTRTYTREIWRASRAEF